jgi:hypothetical protein
MNKRNLRLIQITSILLLMMIPTFIAYAGSKNQNGENGSQGTDKLNGLYGCRAGLNSGNYWVYVPSQTLDGYGFTAAYFHEWEGGPCCPYNMDSDIGNDYPLPNECCNGPDYLPDFLGGAATGEQAPGNHCECFEIRGYPLSILPI